MLHSLLLHPLEQGIGEVAQVVRASDSGSKGKEKKLGEVAQVVRASDSNPPRRTRVQRKKKKIRRGSSGG